MDEDYDAYDSDEEVQADPEEEQDDEAEDPEDNDEEFQSVIVDVTEAKKRMSMAVKKSVNILTRFEKARVLGVRIRQLQMGAPPLVNVSDLKNEKEIAFRELEMRRCPLIVRRYITKSTFEDWRLTEFICV